jgi:hypothetical protein
MSSITYVIDGGIMSLLFSPTRMPENHEFIKLNEKKTLIRENN